MNVTRYESIGIKQVIRLEWMQHAADLLMAGGERNEIRKSLHDYMKARKGSGAPGERGKTSRSQVVNILMKSWIAPEVELIPLRNAAMRLLQMKPAMAVAIHWGVISAAYPFWLNVARHTGRLLALQGQVNQAQIVGRLKERYGDREIISRYGRYVIRSFIAWGVLRDSKVKGCYELSTHAVCQDCLFLLLESALQAHPEGKTSISVLQNDPGFFPFEYPLIAADSVAQSSDRIEVVRYGLDDQLLKLK